MRISATPSWLASAYGRVPCAACASCSRWSRNDQPVRAGLDPRASAFRGLLGHQPGGGQVTEPLPEHVVRPDPDSRLGQLLAQFDAVDSRAKELTKQADALKAAYKAELTAITQPDGTPYTRY